MEKYMSEDNIDSISNSPILKGTYIDELQH